MKLTAMGFDAMDNMCGQVGEKERVALNELLTTLLGDLPKESCQAIEKAIATYAGAVQEESFVAGLDVGRNPLALLATPF